MESIPICQAIQGIILVGFIVFIYYVVILAPKKRIEMLKNFAKRNGFNFNETDKGNVIKEKINFIDYMSTENNMTNMALSDEQSKIRIYNIISFDGASGHFYVFDLFIHITPFYSTGIGKYKDPHTGEIMHRNTVTGITKSLEKSILETICFFEPNILSEESKRLQLTDKRNINMFMDFHHICGEKKEINNKYVLYYNNQAPADITPEAQEYLSSYYDKRIFTTIEVFKNSVMVRTMRKDKLEEIENLINFTKGLVQKLAQ